MAASTFAINPQYRLKAYHANTSGVLRVCKRSVSGHIKFMTQLLNLLNGLARNRKGQDLIEYALMAGFVAVAAGAIMPGVASSISTIFSKVASVLEAAASAS